MSCCSIIKISSHLVNSLLLEKLAIAKPSLYSVRRLRQRCNLDHMITTYIVQEVVVLYLGKCALDEYSMNTVSKRGSITDHGYLHGQLVEVLYLRNLGRIDIQHGGEHPAPSISAAEYPNRKQQEIRTPSKTKLLPLRVGSSHLSSSVTYDKQGLSPHALFPVRAR